MGSAVQCVFERLGQRELGLGLGGDGGRRTRLWVAALAFRDLLGRELAKAGLISLLPWGGH